MRDLLRETQDVRVETYGSLLEAEVAEARAIARELPPYNRRGKGTRPWYLKVDQRRSKVAPARVPKEDGSAYLGPFPSLKSVKALVDVIRSAVPLHRCADPAKCRGCAFADLGRCTGTESDLHADVVAVVARAMTGEHGLLLEPLDRRMRDLAAAERFEEAEELRREAATLASALARAAEVRSLVAAQDVVLCCGERIVHVHRGRLLTAVDAAEAGWMTKLPAALEVDGCTPSFLSPDDEREARVISAWIRRRTNRAEVISVSGTWAMGVASAPSLRFEKRSAQTAGAGS
jgi:excinuclease UvrABC nuclease subunit